MEKALDVLNFDNFTAEEYQQNLFRLGVSNHASLVGKKVYYSNKLYGEHTVIKWDSEKAEFLLDIDGQRFFSNPFRILLTNK